MNATELFLQNGTSANIYFCEKCRRVAGSQLLANQCCQNYLCNICGKDVGSRSSLRCPTCTETVRAEKEAARFAAAQQITTWTGPLYYPGTSYQDGFFDDLDEFEDWLAQEQLPTPQYVWTVEPEYFVNLDIDTLITEIEENGYEDFDRNTIKGIPELTTALEAFNQTNRHITKYKLNYKQALLLSELNTTNMHPNYLEITTPHGRLICVPPNQPGIPIEAATKIMGGCTDQEFLHTGIASHYNANNYPHKVIFAITNNPEASVAWEQDIAQTLQSEPPELRWWKGTDTGLSSRAIFRVLCQPQFAPAPSNTPNVPSDAGDFGRCQRLIQTFPEWRSRLPEVASAYPNSLWPTIIENWNHLTSLDPQAQTLWLRDHQKRKTTPAAPTEAAATQS